MYTTFRLAVNRPSDDPITELHRDVGLTLPLDVAQLIESGAGVSPSVSSSHCRPELQPASIPGSGSVLKLPEVFSGGKSLESNYYFTLSLKILLPPLHYKESLGALKFL